MPSKYATLEEKQAAIREQKREWAARYRQQVKAKTYSEKIAEMTPEQYKTFIDKQTEYNKIYRANKKKQTNENNT